MTEMQKLKIKKTKDTASPADLTRLKQLQDGEPLSEADLENAKKREEEREAKDKAAFEAKQRAKNVAHLKNHPAFDGPVSEPDGAPQCFGKFFSLGALDCTTVCSFKEDCKRQSNNPNASLDVPAEHPRIVALKEALLPFTQIEAHDSRPNEFVLITRGISITAGDVRKARKAMTL